MECPWIAPPQPATSPIHPDDEQRRECLTDLRFRRRPGAQFHPVRLANRGEVTAPDIDYITHKIDPGAQACARSLDAAGAIRPPRRTFSVARTAAGTPQLDSPAA